MTSGSAKRSVAPNVSFGSGKVGTTEMNPATAGGLDTLTFLAVLAAALMHAGWNAIVKVGLDRFSSMLLIALVSMGLALSLIPVFPLPAAAAWPWVIGSGLLHTGYKLFLVQAYTHGDLSYVYPIARGTAPLIVAVVGVFALGEEIGTVGATGIALIGLGVVSMSLRGGGIGANRTAILWALGTTGFTASYTLADTIGARLSGTASGFVMWMFVVDGIAMSAFAVLARGRAAFGKLRPAWRSGLVAGVLSLGSYWVAVWAFTRAPVGLVAALRETSVLWAMLIGVLLLGERGGPWRWGAAAMIASGLILVRV